MFHVENFAGLDLTSSDTWTDFYSKQFRDRCTLLFKPACNLRAFMPSYYTKQAVWSHGFYLCIYILKYFPDFVSCWWMNISNNILAVYFYLWKQNLIMNHSECSVELSFKMSLAMLLLYTLAIFNFLCREHAVPVNFLNMQIPICYDYPCDSLSVFADFWGNCHWYFHLLCKKVSNKFC